MSDARKPDVNRIRKADSPGGPIGSCHDGQRRESVQWNVVPACDTFGIGGKGSDGRQGTQDMCVPRDHRVADLLADFEQQHGERDRGERLPEFGDFVVDEGRDESCARQSEEAAEGSLIAVVLSSGSPFRCEIECRSEDRQDNQASSDVSVLGSSLCRFTTATRYRVNSPSVAY